MTEPKNPRIFTTGRIAKMLGCAPRTVSEWVDDGKIEGYRLPSKSISSEGDRRVTKEALLRFLKANKMPLYGLEEESRLLAIGVDEPLFAAIRKALPQNGSIHYSIATTGFEAGIITAEQDLFDTVLVDFSLGRNEAIQIAHHLRRYPRYRDSAIVALASEDETNEDELREVGFTEVFRKPVDVGELTDRIKYVVNADWVKPKTKKTVKDKAS